MPYPTWTPPGTDTAGTYYFLDKHIEADGRRYNGVISGLQVSQATTPSLTLQVSAGEFHQLNMGDPNRSWPGGTVTLPAADPDFPRVDTISIYFAEGVDDLAHVVVTPGVANDHSNPGPVLAPPANRTPLAFNIVLATVMVMKGVTQLFDEDIYDRRFPLPFHFSGNTETLVTSLVSFGAVGIEDRVACWTVDGNLTASDRDVNLLGDVRDNSIGGVLNQVALWTGPTSVHSIHNATETGRPLLTGGVLSVGALDLASEVTGDLPLANLAPASAASRLLLRGSASGAGDWQEGTLGTGLSLAGTVLSATGGAGSGPTTVRLTANATANATTTGVEITGLKKASTGTGTFVVKYVLRYQSSVTGNGVKFGVNHTGTTPVFMFSSVIQVVGGGANAASQSQTTPANPGGMSTRSKSTTAPNMGPTTSVDAANSDMLWIIDGLLHVTGDGDLELWHASEGAVSTQVMAESCLLLFPVA